MHCLLSFNYSLPDIGHFLDLFSLLYLGQKKTEQVENPGITVRTKISYLKLGLALLCLGVLISCEPSVVFGEPQPEGIKSLSKIPDDYQGIYWCNVDSASLFV